MLDEAVKTALNFYYNLEQISPAIRRIYSFLHQKS